MTAPTTEVFGVFDNPVRAVYRLAPEAQRLPAPGNASQLPTPRRPTQFSDQGRLIDGVNQRPYEVDSDVAGIDDR